MPWEECGAGVMINGVARLLLASAVVQLELGPRLFGGGGRDGLELLRVLGGHTSKRRLRLV